MPTFLLLCAAALEKPSEDIQIEFFVPSYKTPFTLELVTLFKPPPREVSLFPFTKLQRDWSLSFSSIVSLNHSANPSLYCFGGAVPHDRVTGPFTTLTNFSEYKSVPRSELYCYNAYNNAHRFQLFKPSRDVFVFDLFSSERYWKPLPPMSVGRCKPFVLSQQHKIFVFGCSLTPLKDLHPFAEVYDPFTNEWTTLIDSVPPLLSDDSIPPLPADDFISLLDKPAASNCVFIDNQTKVLVILSEEDLSFTWPLDSSIPIDCPTPYSYCPSMYSRDPILVVDDIAFVCVTSQMLYAYRLKNGMFSGYDESPIEPTLVKGFELHSLGSPTYPSFFVLLGHMDFCMVWQNLNPTVISYVRFHIVKNGDSLEDLSVIVDGISAYSKEGNSPLLSASML